MVIVKITATAKYMDQVDLAKTHLDGSHTGTQDTSPDHLPCMYWSQWNLVGVKRASLGAFVKAIVCVSKNDTVVEFVSLF